MGFTAPGGGAGEEAAQTAGADDRNTASIASLRLLAKEHQLQTMYDVKHAATTFLR